MSEDKGTPSGVPTLTELTERIRREMEAAATDKASYLRHAIRAGQYLIEAKKQVGHGEWLPWLEENFPNNRKTAALYMKLAAESNVQEPGHLGGTIQAADAATRKSRRRDFSPQPRPTTPQREDVLQWVDQRTQAGRTRDEMIEESKRGAEGYPADGKPLSRVAVDRAKSVNEDRRRHHGEERPKPTPRPKPKESGKRLRELHAQKRENGMTALLNLQMNVMKAVSVLEGVEIHEVGPSDEEQDALFSIHGDLEILDKWTLKIIAGVESFMDDVSLQRKIKALRARASDPSSTEFERISAARLAERAEKRHGAARLSPPA